MNGNTEKKHLIAKLSRYVLEVEPILWLLILIRAILEWVGIKGGF